jgi:hypothetical protein
LIVEAVIEGGFFHYLALVVGTRLRMPGFRRLEKREPEAADM